MSCEGCMYWSEMVAESIGGGPVLALCLHENMVNVPHDQRMKHAGCKDKEYGDPIDAPWMTAR